MTHFVESSLQTRSDGIIAPYRLDYYPYYDQISQNHTELMQTGYAKAFQDPSFERTGRGGNQAHHYWFFVQVGYESSFGVAVLGGVLHETVFGDRVGMSYEDYALAVEGAALGQALRLGIISPNEVGDYINHTLSPGSYSAYMWENPQTPYIP